MRIGIIGAGPAGTVCALALLHGARQRGQQHEVLLFDGKSFLDTGPRGCNMCAGVISASLLDRLAALGAEVPPDLVQREVTGHYFETIAGGVHMPKDPAARICTVFRSAGPRGEAPHLEQSFDNMLQRSALAAGAEHVEANVVDVRMPAAPDGPFTIVTAGDRAYEVDVLVGAFGVNSALPARFETLGFGYRRPGTYHVAQAELPLAEEFIEQRFRGEIFIFSLGLSGIRFGALTPKRHHLTATVIGPHLEHADLLRFLEHPQVRRHFPADWQPPETFCHCRPKLPVTAARNAVADRLIIIGDAHLSRYLKGGIESAFFTGSLAAQMMLDGRLSRRELVRGYVRPCYARYRNDDLYGRLLFLGNDLLSRLPLVARIGLRLLEREQQLPAWEDRRQTHVLWHVFVGDLPYRRILLDALSPRTVLAALATLPRRSQSEDRLPVSRVREMRSLSPDCPLGPLRDGQTVAIIGGGPGGMSCALTLKREAARRNIALNVIVFEGKRFGLHYNQCAGVLSPPLLEILEAEHGITLPPEMCRRVIRGYVLHTGPDSITLDGAEHGGVSLAVHRVEFDEHLARCAEQRGIKTRQDRVTDLEFRRDGVIIFTWGGTFRADVVVGAFGLSRAMTATLAHRTPYRPPRALETVVTNHRPDRRDVELIPGLLDDHIHVLLPRLPRIEFGALIPKGNHVTVIIAGDGLRTDDMDAFLELPPVRRLIPGRPAPDDYYKGHFPISLARGAFGDRYVTVGDAAGLVRPFKGKGINSAIITGGLAAMTMLEHGISAAAFREFHRQCRHITGDLYYGRFVRWLAHLVSHRLSMIPAVRLARHDPALRALLFDAISGEETYRDIVLRADNLRLAARLGAATLAFRLLHPRE